MRGHSIQKTPNHQKNSHLHSYKITPHNKKHTHRKNNSLSLFSFVMEEQVTKFSLGNVSVNGRKMRDETFATEQQKMQEAFISFLRREGAPKFTILSNDLKCDGYELKIRYTGPVDMKHREAIKVVWRRVKITTDRDCDSLFLPFREPGRLSRFDIFDACLFLGLILIMIMCVYIQMLNKPQRYGGPFFHVLL